MLHQRSHFPSRYRLFRVRRHRAGAGIAKTVFIGTSSGASAAEFGDDMFSAQTYAMPLLNEAGYYARRRRYAIPDVLDRTSGIISDERPA